MSEKTEQLKNLIYQEGVKVKNKSQKDVIMNSLSVIDNLEEMNLPDYVKAEKDHLTFYFNHKSGAVEEIRIYNLSMTYNNQMPGKVRSLDSTSKMYLFVGHSLNRKDAFFLNKEMDWFRIELKGLE